MGGRPLTALNLVGFPDHLLPVAVLGEILRGGADVAAIAGIDIAGGHTIKSDEPIYGLAVTGIVHPRRVVTNAGGRHGDALVLTKPLGLGILTTAAKQDRDTLGAIGHAIELMATLNRAAAEAMSVVAEAVHAATDITGFGLLGHLRNITRASGVGAVVSVSTVPVIPAARAYVADGIVPGGTHANRRFLMGIPDGERWVEPGPADEAMQLILCDAQTSGGLLIALDPARLDELLAALAERGVEAHPIGRLDGAVTPGHIELVA
jgi:selenide,water dikinase